jgi:hypothetical protein
MEEEEKLYSRIGIMNENGTILSVYCEYGGDIENVGKTLYEYYNTREAVSDLIKRGSIVELKKYVDKGIFDKDESKEDTTIFIIRDLNYSPRLFTYVNNRNIKGFVKTAQDIGAEYAYLFTKDDKWVVVDMVTGDIDSLESVLNELEGRNTK